MIYLASPYSSLDKAKMEYRYHTTMEAVALFFKQRIFVYSPIVHCHELARRFSLPTHADFWLAFNHEFIDKSKQIYVLCSEGWKDSIGVAEEISYAMTKGYPVEFWANSNEKMVNVTQIVTF